VKAVVGGWTARGDWQGHGIGGCCWLACALGFGMSSIVFPFIISVLRADLEAKKRL